MVVHRWPKIRLPAGFRTIRPDDESRVFRPGPPLDRFTLRDFWRMAQAPDALVVVKATLRRVDAVALLRGYPGHVEIEFIARDRNAPRGTGRLIMSVIEQHVVPATGMSEIRLEAVGRGLKERFYEPLGYEQFAPSYVDPAWPEPLFPLRKQVPSSGGTS